MGRYKYLIITLVLTSVVTISLLYYVLVINSSYRGTPGKSSGSINTEVIGSNASLTKLTKAVTSSESLKDVIKSLISKARKLHSEGYDTTYAHYLLLSSAWYLRRGDLGRAEELLKKAEELLSNPVLRGSVSKLNFTIKPYALVSTKQPSKWDFVPLGTVFVRSKYGYLTYPRNDRNWVLSCFILVAVGRSEDGKVVAYQGRLPLSPTEGVFRPRVFIGGKWRVLNTLFTGPLYYEEGSNYVKVYEYDLSHNYMQYIEYVVSNHTWIHAIINLRSSEELIKVVGKPEGPPMWLGGWGSTYLPHGIYSRVKGIDLWSGFWVVGPAEVTVKVGNHKGVFRGFFVFDRASHRSLILNEEAVTHGRGSPVAFTCMVIKGRGFYIALTYSRNPSPLNVTLEHQLRMVVNGEVVDVSNFTVVDDGSIQPKWFRVYAKLPNGYLRMYGKVINYWPPTWPRSLGTWWNPNATTTWGRAFTLWAGKAVINGREYSFKAVGVGEYTRYSPRKYLRVGCSEACWANS